MSAKGHQETKKQLRINEAEVKWVKDNLTDGLETGSINHGQVIFQGATRRAKGKFVRLPDVTDIAKVYELMTKIWGLEVPRLLISVTGGAKSLVLDPKLKDLFASGLSKVAQTPGAWIITGGTNTGVMKHVGEALQGVTKACIGIATWGIIQHRDQLSCDEQPAGGKFSYSVASSLVEKGAFLDHNHTHFLLVDNGTTGKYGVEIPFRAALEKHVMEKVQDNKRVPSVLLVLEGGPGTLGTVTNAVKGEHAIPVVIIKDSGRAADCIAYALETMSDEDAQEYQTIHNPHPDVLTFVKETFPEVQDEEKLGSLYAKVLECVHARDAFTVFQMGSGADVDEAILTALLHSHKTSPVSQLQLTLLWNRADLAREKILCQGKKNWVVKDLNDTMMMALATNSTDFVQLLLGYGISIPSLLTNDRLEFLYGFRSRMNTSTLRYEFEANHYTSPKKADDVMHLLCKFEGFDLSTSAIPRNIITRSANKLLDCFSRQGTEQFLENINSGSTFTSSIEMNNTTQTFRYPFRELFVWAVMNNMLDMALFLWEFEEEAMAKAFIGGAISQSLQDRAVSFDLGDEIEQSLADNVVKFNGLALGLLDECYKSDQKKTEGILTTECLQFPSQTCLGLAVASEHKQFVSHSSVQALLNDVWTGAIKQYEVTSRQVILGLLFPPYALSAFTYRNESELKKMARADEDFDVDDVDEQDKETSTEESSGRNNASLVVEGNTSNEGDSSVESNRRLVEEKPRDYQSTAVQQPIDKRKQDKDKELPWYTKLNEFYFKTPITKFFTNLMAYCVFLGLFAYVAILKKHGTRPGVAEWILISFVVSLTVEEIYQFIQSDSHTFIGKFSDWTASKWNLLDLIAIVLFYVALGLRLNSSTSHIGHLLYALDVGLWILRLLEVFYVHRILGPYVVMIYKMFIDMMYFLVILFVFLLAYGVSTKAILSPQEHGWDMLRDSFFHPYFNIYGELFIDRDPENAVTTRFGTPVINSYAEPITWVLLGGYLLIANVLLLNLLIAIFNNTFTAVQENSAQIWKFERYHLILDYAKRPPLTPPFMLLCHLYLLIRWVIRLCTKCCQGDTDASGQRNELQSRLSEQEKDELIEFEMDCMASFLRSRRDPWTIEAQEESAKTLVDKVEDLNSMLGTLGDRLKLVEYVSKNEKK